MDGTVVKAKSIQREQELVKIEGQKIEGPKNWADFYASVEEILRIFKFYHLLLEPLLNIINLNNGP